ncbi:MAG: alginate export family protein, partial [bacterium]
NYNPKDNIQLSLANFYPTFGAFEISTANRTIRNINLSYFSYSFAPNKDTDFRIYFINYKDSRNILKPSNTPNIRGKTDISSLGFHFVKVIRKENYNIDLVAWYGYQWGKWGEINSNKITHKAYAYDIEVGYKFNKILWKPHFRVYYTFGSGDPNPNDDKHNTYFVFAPTARKYALFPFYNYQNLKDLTFQLIAYPSKNLRLRMDYSILSLANNQDGWYSGAGAFNDSSFGIAYKRSNGLSKLADVLSLDLSYNLSANTTINLFYSLAQGKDLVKNIYHSSNSTYLLLTLTQKI